MSVHTCPSNPCPICSITLADIHDAYLRVNARFFRELDAMEEAQAKASRDGSPQGRDAKQARRRSRDSAISSKTHSLASQEESNE